MLQLSDKMVTPLNVATERAIKQNQEGQAFILVANSTVMEYTFLKRSVQPQTYQYKDVNS